MQWKSLLAAVCAVALAICAFAPTAELAAQEKKGTLTGFVAMRSRESFQIGLTVTEFGKAIMFVEVEPESRGSTASLWLSTYGLDDARAQARLEAPGGGTRAVLRRESPNRAVLEAQRGAAVGGVTVQDVAQKIGGPT